MGNVYCQTNGHGFFFDEKVEIINTERLLKLIKSSSKTMKKLLSKVPDLIPFLENNGERITAKKINQIMKDYESDYSSCEGLAILYADMVNEHTCFELLVLEDY